MVKNDKLDMLIMMSSEVLAERNLELFESTDTTGVSCSKALDRRVRRNINKEYRRKEYGSLYKYAKAVIAAILIICTVSFAAIMSVEAVRNTLWKAILEFFDDYLAVTYVSDYAPMEIDRITEVNPSMEEWDKEVLLESDSMYFAVYRKNGVKMLSYTKEIMNGSEIWLDNENTSVKEVKVGNYDGLLFTRHNETAKILSWSDGKYLYLLEAESPDITNENLIEWAQNME